MGIQYTCMRTFCSGCILRVNTTKVRSHSETQSHFTGVSVHAFMKIITVIILGLTVSQTFPLTKISMYNRFHAIGEFVQCV